MNCGQWAVYLLDGVELAVLEQPGGWAVRCQNAVHEDRYLDHALATALDLRQLHALAIAARILESPPGTEVGDRASGSPGPGELPID